MNSVWDLEICEKHGGVIRTGPPIVVSPCYKDPNKLPGPLVWESDACLERASPARRGGNRASEGLEITHAIGKLSRGPPDFVSGSFW